MFVLWVTAVVAAVLVGVAVATRSRTVVVAPVARVREKVPTAPAGLSPTMETDMADDEYVIREGAQPDAVIAHRAKMLVDRGVDPEQALALAERLDVDVHAVASWLDRGCSPATAVLIAS